MAKTVQILISLHFIEHQINKQTNKQYKQGQTYEQTKICWKLTRLRCSWVSIWVVSLAFTSSQGARDFKRQGVYKLFRCVFGRKPGNKSYRAQSSRAHNISLWRQFFYFAHFHATTGLRIFRGRKKTCFSMKLVLPLMALSIFILGLDLTQNEKVILFRVFWFSVFNNALVIFFFFFS